MADRIAVFNEGKIVQVGKPEDIYYRPEVPFVADFVGSSNVLPPHVTEKTKGIWANAAVRPEAVRLGDEGLPATVRATSFIGTSTRVSLEVDGIQMIALLPKGQTIPSVGERTHVSWADDDIHLMEQADE